MTKKLPYTELMWDDENGIILANDGRQLFQIRCNYGSAKDRNVLGKLLVELYNRHIVQEGERR
jgi:hypothetical protein